MLNIWLLYDSVDLAVNRDFAALLERYAAARGMKLETVTLQEITLCCQQDGTPFCLWRGKKESPDLVISRMRDSLYSYHFEAMGIPVLNSAAVCEICNDKRRTNQFLAGLPMPETSFIVPNQPEPREYPLVVKPACSHGGDRVQLVSNAGEWRQAAQSIWPEPAIQQKVVQRPGMDLRVYVLFGQITAGVLRRAKQGIVSNYKQGGSVELHRLTASEEHLAQAVVERFRKANAPLCFAGIDLLYQNDRPVIGEVEDVVGSRMLYQTSTIDIAALYLDGIKAKYAV